MMRPLFALVCGLLVSHPSAAPPQLTGRNVPTPRQIFSGTSDIGAPLQGNSQHEGGDNQYRLSGAGYDVWGTSDHFRYTWTMHPGDAVLNADLHLEAPVSNRFAKGMLMFRQSLNPDSPYADIVLQADGHAALQYRLLPGGETREIILTESNPSHLRLVRQGDRFTAYALTAKGRQVARPASVSVPMPGLLYTGLGVCSHNAGVLQNVTFSAVSLTTP